MLSYCFSVTYVFNTVICLIFSQFAYNSLQPTLKEVQSLDLSFKKGIEICDPVSIAFTSAAHKLKRVVDEK